jgi:hypothetical protein
MERLHGPLDNGMVADILALSPTLHDLEQAALWIAGEGETLPERHQPHRTVLAIVELIGRDEEDEGRDRR